MEQSQVGSVERPPLQINAFPKGPELWRVDWFGPVMFPNKAMRVRQKSVLVYLSRVVAPDALTKQFLLLYPEATDSGRQTKCWVSVGTLMLLRIGDIWSDQKLVASPSYTSATFEKLQIKRETVDLVKAGMCPYNGVFLLPLNAHPWHRENTQSYCLRVRLPDRKSLVIPCMELIRFYFGSSSTLLSTLFDPPLPKEKLFSNVIFNPNTKWMSIDLAEGLPKASASDVARIAASHTAWRAASRILISCLNASIAGQDMYPQTFFPFEGLTNLTVTGKWLPLGGVPQQTFIVNHLDICTHAFPFSSLRYRTFNERKRRVLMPGTEAETKPKISQKVEKITGSGLVEKDASNTLGKTQVSVRRTRYFPDLDHKKLVGRRDLTKPPPTISIGPAVPAVNELAVGEPGSTKRVRSVMLTEAASLENFDQPVFLKSTVKAMEGLDNFEIDLLTASDEDGWTVPVELLNDDDGIIANELFINPDGHPRQRRAAAFSLSHASEHMVLVLIEGEQLIPLVYPVDKAGLQEPWPALRCAAQDFVSKVTNPHRIDVVFYNGDTPSQREVIRGWIRDLWN